MDSSAAWASRGRYNIHMRRTTLMLDAQLLDQARQVLGARTYSAAVNLAIEEVLRVRKVQALSQFLGQRLWQGDPSEMREDRVARRPRK
jgi:Arc/MetJ family transcription regulator